MMHGVDPNPKASKHYAKASNMMGLTAEMLGRLNGITREEQDTFGVHSHKKKAWAATQAGRFDNEIVGVEGHDSEGNLQLCTVDEVIRPDANLEAFQALRPVFDPKKWYSYCRHSLGTVRWCFSNAYHVSPKKAKDLGLKPRARIRGMAVAGCDAAIMGYGPVPATQKNP